MMPPTNPRGPKTAIVVSVDVVMAGVTSRVAANAAGMRASPAWMCR